MLRLFGYINITNGDIALNREQAGLENDELALGGVHEVGKAPRQTAQRVVEKRIDGARKGIVAIIYIVLIGLPAVLGRSLVKPGNRHRTDILLECEVGGVALVVEPVAADNAILGLVMGLPPRMLSSTKWTVLDFLLSKTMSTSPLSDLGLSCFHWVILPDMMAAKSLTDIQVSLLALLTISAKPS